jgi:RND family efflux transporter MFP subunit
MNTESQPPQQPKDIPLPEASQQGLRRCSRWGQDILRTASARVSGTFRRVGWRILGLLLCATVLISVWRALAAHARSPAAPIPTLHALPVAVARVTRQDLYSEQTFYAEFRPYVEVELHAKVSGYVRQMKVDFGDRVKAGQLLATLEVPELGDELQNAVATEQKAEADYTNAHKLYQRLAAVNSKAHPDLVPQQDIDTAEAKDRTTFAAIAAAKADVAKYQSLVDYTRITAPFDGVITKRYADPGALIQAGTASDTQALPLVRVSDNYRLRLDFPVDLRYVKDIHVGDPVEVQVESLGDKILSGKITRSSLRVDDATRTMTAEIEVPNPNLELVPGMYARVVLKVQRCPQALAVPTEAVARGGTQAGAEGGKATVYIVNSEQRVEERAVMLGLETPASYEVLSGLKEGDLVLVGDRSKVTVGQQVEAKLVGSLAQQ